MSDIISVRNGGLTAGLKSPPLMRKKIHAFTARLNPNDREMYSSFDGSTPPVLDPVVLLFSVVPAPMFATCVPPNAKKRKKVVPMNSPIMATVSAIVLVIGFFNRADDYVRFFHSLCIHLIHCTCPGIFSFSFSRLLI